MNGTCEIPTAMLPTKKPAPSASHSFSSSWKIQLYCSLKISVLKRAETVVPMVNSSPRISIGPGVPRSSRAKAAFATSAFELSDASWTPGPVSKRLREIYLEESRKVAI